MELTFVTSKQKIGPMFATLEFNIPTNSLCNGGSHLLSFRKFEYQIVGSSKLMYDFVTAQDFM